MLEKLLDLLTNEKVDSAKLHVILILLGAIVVFFAEKIPLDVSERSLVQVAGFVVLLIGLGLLFIAAIDRLFRVSTLGGMADGILSGLAASSFVAIFFFAPNSPVNDEDFFLYRLFLVSVYGMMYGGFIGTFSVFFVSRSQNIYRFFSASLIFFVFFVWVVSYFIFPRIPIVTSDPITLGEIFLMHVFYVLIFSVVHSRGWDVFRVRRRFRPYFYFTLAIVVILLFIKIENVYPAWSFGDERIWNANFYLDYKPSYYLFGLTMVVMFIYSSLSIIFIFRDFVLGESSKYNVNRQDEG